MKENNFTLQFNIESFTEEVARKVAEKLNLKSDQEPQDQEQFLTTQEAMEFLKISSPVTLKSYVDKGFIPKPARRGGRQLFYKKSDLEKFLSYGV